MSDKPALSGDLQKVCIGVLIGTIGTSALFTLGRSIKTLILAIL
jgi:hypothetical protein